MAPTDKPWQSLTAGLIAGAIEGFITYPAELTKTACQFSAKQGAPVSPLAVIQTTFRQNGIKGFYSGCSALVVGNAAKAGVRFLSYDSIKQALRDPVVGTPSGGAVLALTLLARPTDWQAVNRQWRTSWHGSRRLRGDLCCDSFRNHQVRLLRARRN